MRSSKKRDNTRRQDREKNNIISHLCGILSSSGHTVRREKLKQGHGWRASSGVCSKDGSKIVFVDRRLSEEDQISFLCSTILEQSIDLEEAQLEGLPSSLVQVLLHSKHPAGAENGSLLAV